MLSRIGATGAMALVGIATARTVAMCVARRGTKPTERPEIIRALHNAKSVKHHEDDA
ncbi:hypothetical protein [Kibdelosporangium aridum]|uniref:hypothetical protein n=1 Tax=Kibdelosporangium aridum TaxID=2030 RepID=UPI0035EA1A6B